jgi:predicted nucleotidyltransferase
MDRDATIAKIREHADELRKRGVTGMYLFGSLARGEATDESDVDIFFDYDRAVKFSLLDLVGVKIFLERLLGTKKTDVLDRDSLHPRLKEKIIRESIQIFDGTTRN